MNTIEILTKARTLLSRPRAWLGRSGVAYARSAKGRVVRSNSRRAVCWCAAGAITAAAGGYNPERMLAYRALVETLDADCLESWNDRPGRKIGSVLKAFDDAIRANQGSAGVEKP